MTNNQEPEHRHIDNEGNYNERIEGDYIQGRNNFLNNSFVVSLFGRPGSPEPLSSKRLSQIRQVLLKQVEKEVESRLNSSLHNRVYIALNTEQNPEQIELPWASEIKVGNFPKIKLDNTDIVNVFDQSEVAGRLLILGQPGAGKTTMLLKLTDELVKRAKNNQADPVPVLFTLSDWKKNNQNIKDWLVEQLKSKYGVRKDIGRQWVANQEIIPLLDGLDELATERQEKCVIQINEFLHPKNWNSPLVICSRIEEYQRYTTLLQLNNSLELSPLSLEQVTQYLQNTGDLQLLSNISHDTDLRELAKIPLLLNIIVLSAEEISIQKWQQFNSSEERLSYLFDAYIRRMLKRPYKDKDKQPQSENTQRWLSWLAQQLIEENITEFLIEKIQPDWLKNKFQKAIYSLIVWGIIGSLVNGLIWSCISLISKNELGITFGFLNGLIIGGLSGIIFVIFSEQLSQVIENKIFPKIILFKFLLFLSKKTITGIIVGFISGIVYAIYNLILLWFLGFYNIFNNILNSSIFLLIIFGLIVGGTYGLIGDTIQTIETLKFSLKTFFSRWRECLIIGLVIGVIIGFIVYLNIVLNNGVSENLSSLLRNDLLGGIIIGLFLGLIIYLIIGIITGIDGLEIEKKIYPNQGIWRSVRSFIIVSLTISLLIVIIIFCIEINLKYEILNSVLAGILLGIFLGIPRSGTPAIKHFILRIILWSNGYIPWDYAKFLNYSTQRLFLQRVGGGYRFIHDLLRQHFANYSTQINLVPTYSKLQILQIDFKKILLVIGILVLMGYLSWQYNLHYTTIYTYYDRGLAYSEKKEYDQAIADFTKAITLDPKYADAYIGRGFAYNEKKEYDQAIAEYNKAITLDPKSTNAYTYLGKTYNDKKEYDQAITEYNKAITIDPNYASAYNNRGLAYNNKKNYDLAIADESQAIKLDPYNAEAYYNEGIAYKIKGIKNKALEDFKKVMQLNNDVELSQKAKLELKKLGTR